MRFGLCLIIMCNFAFSHPFKAHVRPGVLYGALRENVYNEYGELFLYTVFSYYSDSVTTSTYNADGEFHGREVYLVADTIYSQITVYGPENEPTLKFEMTCDTLNRLDTLKGYEYGSFGDWYLYYFTVASYDSTGKIYKLEDFEIYADWNLSRVAYYFWENENIVRVSNTNFIDTLETHFVFEYCADNMLLSHNSYDSNWTSIDSVSYEYENDELVRVTIRNGNRILQYNELIYASSNVISKKYRQNEPKGIVIKKQTRNGFVIWAEDDINIKLDLYSISGRKIHSVYNGFLKKGDNKIQMGTNIAPSSYVLVDKNRNEMVYIFSCFE